VDDALDAQTWTIVVGVVIGFFAVPAAMLAYDLRRQLRRRRSPSPHDLHRSGIDAPRALDGLKRQTTSDETKAR
jgi:surfactin synthase thioesterase subunit